MGFEGFKPKLTQTSSESIPDDVEKAHVAAHEQIGPDVLLGEGFDKAYFADKLLTFPYDSMFREWNAFLKGEEGGALEDKIVEKGSLDRIYSKLSGKSNSQLMFPVFIQGLQSYYKERGISSDHVTPERMQVFYDLMSKSDSRSSQ